MAAKKAIKETPVKKSPRTVSAKKAAPRKKVAPVKKEEMPVQMPKPTLPQMPKFDKTNVITSLRKPQIFIPLAVLVVFLVVYLLRSWFVVAMVNGQFVTRSAFESAMEQQDGKQILNSLITQKLIEQEAARKGVSVKQSDIDSQIKTIDKQLASQGQTLDQALAARGMTKSDLEDQIRLQSLLDKLLADEIKVSDKEVQDYIDKNKDSLPQGQSDSQLKATVKQQLQQEKLTTAAQTLVQKLQQQAHIMYFINL